MIQYRSMLVCAATVTLAALLSAAGPVSTLSATPSRIRANQPTEVEVAMKVEQAGEITSVNLMRVGADGSQTAIAALSDQGGGVYAARVRFQEAAGAIQLRASIAVRGQMKRSASEVLTIPCEP